MNAYQAAAAVAVVGPPWHTAVVTSQQQAVADVAVVAAADAAVVPTAKTVIMNFMQLEHWEETNNSLGKDFTL